MQEKNNAIQQKRRKEAKPNYQVRIGINTGFATVGNIGSSNRLKYTVIGDNVNIAARLEKADSPGKVLIGESTYELVKEYFVVKELEPFAVKGKEMRLKVYEVIGKFA